MTRGIEFEPVAEQKESIVKLIFATTENNLAKYPSSFLYRFYPTRELISATTGVWETGKITSGIFLRALFSPQIGEGVPNQEIDTILLLGRYHLYATLKRDLSVLISTHVTSTTFLKNFAANYPSVVPKLPSIVLPDFPPDSSDFIPRS